MSEVVANCLPACEGGAPTKDGVLRMGGIGFLSSVQNEKYELIPDYTHLRDEPADLRMLISPLIRGTFRLARRARWRSRAFLFL